MRWWYRFTPLRLYSIAMLILCVYMAGNPGPWGFGFIAAFPVFFVGVTALFFDEALRTVIYKRTLFWIFQGVLLAVGVYPFLTLFRVGR